LTFINPLEHGACPVQDHLMEIVAYPGEEQRECPHCGLLCRLPPRYPGLVADCPRCGEVLWRMRKSRRSFPLSCALAALLFYLFALVAPFLEIQAYGRFSLAKLDSGPTQLIAEGFGLAGMLVFAVTLIAPALKLGLLVTILSGLRILPPSLLKIMFRLYLALAPWAMIDVYLLGFLVAYTKLSGLAVVHLDTAVYALVGCMVSMAAADGSVDIEQVWRTLKARSATSAAAAAAAAAAEGDGTLVGCEACGYLNMVPHGPPGHGMHCQRCGAAVHPRKPDSINRAWALLLAAIALYVPANIYPFMILTTLAHTTGYTIFGGIEELAQSGLWPLALLVFFASITIPLVKIVLLAYMLICSQLGSRSALRFRTSAYRFIDFIGRWSMIDVFMVSILVALLRFGQFVSVHADMGAVCFAGVVVLTIFAVEAFDPRLMWDAERATYE
jgi:paraquat-inducible protein A